MACSWARAGLEQAQGEIEDKASPTGKERADAEWEDDDWEDVLSEQEDNKKG